MDATRFDTDRQALRRPPLSRRAALRPGRGRPRRRRPRRRRSARAARAQDATPAPPTPPARRSMFLFVQSFQSGSIAPKAGEDGTYTLTLEQGPRPDRSTSPTGPNASSAPRPTPAVPGRARLPARQPAQRRPGGARRRPAQTEIAVVELFNPSYDEATHTATYEVAVLAEWERRAGGGLRPSAGRPGGASGTSFGAAHLFIDDCPDVVVCASTKDGLVCSSTSGGLTAATSRGDVLEPLHAAAMGCPASGHATVATTASSRDYLD